MHPRELRRSRCAGMLQGPACLLGAQRDGGGEAAEARLGLLPPQGDPALLEALAIEVLVPGVRIGLPPDLAAVAEAPATAAKPAGAAAAPNGGAHLACALL